MLQKLVTILVLAAALLTPLAVQAQPIFSPLMLAQTTDVDGWNQVNWGMSQTEVKSLYPDAQVKTKDVNGQLITFLSLEQYQVGNYFYQVSFVFSDNRLTSVALYWQGDRRSSPEREALDALRSRYGNYNNVNSIGSLEWLLPKTKISLFKYDFGDHYVVSVSYSEQIQGF